jgi:transcriptional regulator with XRE-family HTH domain
MMTNPIAKNFSDNIKTLRIKRQWTQKNVADRVGISIPAYSKIETGFTNINLSRLVQIADVFKVDLVSLFLTKGQSRPEKKGNDYALQEKLLNQEAEISNLQRKLIELYEDLRKKR